MNIFGISYTEFFKRLHTAYGESQGNTTVRESIVRKMLTRVAFPNGEGNEHQLEALFTEQAAPGVPSRETYGCVVILEHYTNDDRGNVLEDVDCHICIGKTAIEAKMRELFSHNYPDYSGHRLLDATMVTDHIEGIDDDRDEDDETDTLYDTVSEMNEMEAEEWLLENFSIDDLVSDDFFGDFLHMDTRKVRLENSDINYSNEA